MAYATTNPPALLAGATNVPSLWVYKSADAVADVDGTDYFSNGVALGMKLGDMVWVYNTAGACTMCYVSAVGTAAVTVTQHA